MKVWWCVGLALVLGACGVAPQPAPLGVSTEAARAQRLPPRPPGSPDVVVFVVSGRCGASCEDAPNDNWNYLEPQGTPEAIAGMFRALGKSTATYSYSAHLRSHQSNVSGKTELGFLDLEARLDEVVRTLVVGRRDPARLVLVGHSHGTNWTRALTRIRPDVTFEYLIDLDGICLAWEDDHRPFIEAYYAERGGNPWREDISQACGRVNVGGLVKYDHKDVAPRNVRYNLEIQSQRLVDQPTNTDLSTNLLFDTVDNVRPDGSKIGVSTFLSYDEGHNEVQLPGSEAMTWLGGKIGALGLP